MTSDILFEDDDLVLEAKGKVRVQAYLEGTGAKLSGLAVLRLETQLLFADADRFTGLPGLPELPRKPRPAQRATNVPAPVPTNPDQAVLFADGLVDLIGYIHLLHRHIASLDERVRKLEKAP